MEKKYSNIIERLVRNFRIDIKEDEYEDMLCKEFRKYLIFSEEQLLNPNSSHPINDDKLLEEILTEISQDLIDSTIEYKKSVLLEDKNMNKIRKISNRINGIAVNSLNGEKIIIETREIKEIEKQLTTLIKQVKSWNKEEAEKLVSETMLELEFLRNPKTNIFSLRLGHIYNNKIKDEEEER